MLRRDVGVVPHGPLGFRAHPCEDGRLSAVASSRDEEMPHLRAGSIGDIGRDTGTWVFVDVGFAREGKTGGLLVHDGEPRELTFSELKAELTKLGSEVARPMNLVIEAPLSVAFTAAGNPAGRSMEKDETGHRYWYAGRGVNQA